MERPTHQPERPTEDPAQGQPDLPEKQDPRRPRPELDPFPGYGEPPAEERREAPPQVPGREWGPGRENPDP